jgi:hypothetical protein
MSEHAGCVERFLCALFATVVKPISDLRLLLLVGILISIFHGGGAMAQEKLGKVDFQVSCTPDGNKSFALIILGYL